MLKGIYTYYLSPHNFIDRNFIVNAGENARCIRFFLEDFENISVLKFQNIVKIDDDFFENEDIEVNIEKSYIDVFLPPLEKGEYSTELRILCGDKNLLSGKFKIKYVESLNSQNVKRLKKIDISDLLDRFLESEKQVADIEAKTKNLKEIVDKNFEYNQMAAAAEWTINHSLDKYPNVTIIDSAGHNLFADISYISKQKIIIRFSSPVSGVAILN